jgi:hypothetical protein
MFELPVLVTGAIVFVARICGVSIGTVRTIATVQGRTAIAFIKDLENRDAQAFYIIAHACDRR